MGIKLTPTNCFSCRHLQGYVNSDEPRDEGNSYCLICDKDHFWLPWCGENQRVLETKDVPDETMRCLTLGQTCTDFERIPIVRVDPDDPL